MNDTNYKSIDFGALTRAGEGLTQWRALAMGFLTALAVGLLPVASVLYERPGARERKSAELRGLVRLFFALLVIEVAALVANYL